jgi:chain length determinant protein EpsF
MNLSRLLLILIARRAILFWTFSLFFGVGILTAILLPYRYTATTDLVLNSRGVDPVTGIALSPLLMPGYMATQLNIITSHNTSLKVVEKLNIYKNKNFINQVFGRAHQDSFNLSSPNANKSFNDKAADALLKNLEVSSSKDSGVISISFKGLSPQFSADVANAFAEAHQENSVLIKIGPAQKAVGILDRHMLMLRVDLRLAQEKLMDYKNKNQLTSESSANLDVESSKLNDLSTQLIAIQSQSIETKSRKEISSKGETSPDIAGDPLVQSIKNQLYLAESKLTELSQHVGPNHPKYQAAKSEVDKLRNQLKEVTQSAILTVGGAAQVNIQRERDLERALVAQKERVLKLNVLRGELAVLQGDVDTAKKALDDFNSRVNENKLEANVNQSDISVLNPALAPSGPSSPRVFLIIFISILLGLLMGITLSLFLELQDRRIRSSKDVADAIDSTLCVIIESQIKIRNNSFFQKITRNLLKTV